MEDTKLYKTKEVCKLHNITKKALLYYDKIDLFKPDYIDQSNNYRYYSRKNLPILKQIIYMKNIGFSLNEIKPLLDNPSHGLMIEHLKEKQHEVQKQIEKYNRMDNSIDYLVKYYEHASAITDNDLYRPSIKMLGHKKVVQKDAKNLTQEGVMLAYRSILNSLREENIFSPEDYGTVYYPDDPKRVGSFIAVPWELDKETVSTIPEGKYICMYHKSSYYAPESRNFLLKWLDDNHYKAIGPIYDHCIVDRLFANGEENMIMELQVHVE